MRLITWQPISSSQVVHSHLKLEGNKSLSCFNGFCSLIGTQITLRKTIFPHLFNCGLALLEQDRNILLTTGLGDLMRLVFDAPAIARHKISSPSQDQQLIEMPFKKLM